MHDKDQNQIEAMTLNLMSLSSLSFRDYAPGVWHTTDAGHFQRPHTQAAARTPAGRAQWPDRIDAVLPSLHLQLQKSQQRALQQHLLSQLHLWDPKWIASSEHIRGNPADPQEGRPVYQRHLTCCCSTGMSELFLTSEWTVTTVTWRNHVSRLARVTALIVTHLSRQGGVSVDCITDLDDDQSQLLEALQLSLPEEAFGNRKKSRDKKLSLNPIYRQVPRAVDLCCQHLEKYGTPL